MKWINSFLIFIFLHFFLHAQEIPQLTTYNDSNYVDYISTVIISGTDNQSNYIQRPIFGMREAINCKFDVLGDNDYYYNYTIVHCDRNWQPTETERNELIQGFDYVRIDNRKFSSGTYEGYIHYDFVFNIHGNSSDWDTSGQENIACKVSGNYLLIVFLKDPTEVVFTRRFIVSENILKNEARGRLTSLGYRSYNSHSFDFESTYSRDMRIDNPQTNVWLTMYQNFEVEGIGPINPRIAIGNTLKWNQPQTFTFAANNEWRINDIRSMRSLRPGNFEIKDSRDSIFIIKNIDLPRNLSGRDTEFDLNGGYSITNANGFSIQTTGDYALVTFYLKSEKPYMENVYVVGGFSQYKCLEKNRMHYNAETKLYEASLFMKQGVYDYLYATSKSGVYPDYVTIEGSDFTTFNQYYGVIYYRSLSQRYDRVIGHYCFLFQCEDPIGNNCGCK